MNIEVSNHMQALEDDQIKALDKKFKKNKRTTINKALKIITKNQTIKTKIKGNKKITKRINNKIIKATKAIKRIIEIIRKNKNNKPQSQPAAPKEIPSKVTYQEGITVGEFADKLNVESSEIIKNYSYLVLLLISINH